MKITFADHRGMGAPLATALHKAGHDIVESGGEVLLIDHDLPLYHYQTFCDAHERVFLYPHGAGLVATGDGQWPTHPHTRGMFVHGSGQAEVLRRAGYPRPTAVIGWPLCTQRAFLSPVPGARLRVIFAPQHALGNGWLDPRLVASNQRVHNQLVMWAMATPNVDLFVRYIGRFDTLGITRAAGVTYVEGQATHLNAVMAINRADLVIGSAWTFPCLAVALGVPTIMYGILPPDDDHGPEERHPAKSWELYKDFVQFPLDADRSTSLSVLIEAACRGSAMVEAWRQQFIGPPFDGPAFVECFERAVKEW